MRLLTYFLLLFITPLRAAESLDQFTVASDPLVNGKPKISIVIDDLGDNSIIAKKMLSLPVRFTAAILPHTPHAKMIAQFAAAQGHQVIMHLPMESFTRTDLLGPGALFADMPKDELQGTLLKSAASVPNLIGFNNHMGSLLTQDYEKMHWVMQSAKQQGWFFLDSKTSVTSVAQNAAKDLGVANIGRDLFLDHQGDSPSLAKQFKRMKKIAIKRGHVVVICHPYPATYQFLAEHIEALSTDFELVGLATLVNLKQQELNNTVNNIVTLNK